MAGNAGASAGHQLGQIVGNWYERYVIVQRGGRRVREHRAIMEEALGRPLEPHEHVHHRNGVRDDNRWENLELWSTSHPPGQRVEDKVAWAKVILELYGDE